MKIPMVWVALILTLLALWLMSPDEEEVTLQQDIYCDMVGRYLDTYGEFGWPDYKGIYETECQ